HPSYSAHTIFLIATNFIIGSPKAAQTRNRIATAKHARLFSHERTISKLTRLSPSVLGGFQRRNPICHTSDLLFCPATVATCDFRRTEFGPTTCAARARLRCRAAQAGMDTGTLLTRSGRRFARAGDASTTLDGAGQRSRLFWRF